MVVAQLFEVTVAADGTELSSNTVTSNTTINKHHHHGGAVCPSYGVGSMDPPNLRRVTSSKRVGQERFGWV